MIIKIVSDLLHPFALYVMMAHIILRISAAHPRRWPPTTAFFDIKPE